MKALPRCLERWLILAVVTALAGCGFHLSRPPDLPFDTLYIDAPNYSSVAADLKRYLSKKTQRRPLIMPVMLEV